MRADLELMKRHASMPFAPRTTRRMLVSSICAMNMASGSSSSVTSRPMASRGVVGTATRPTTTAGMTAYLTAFNAPSNATRIIPPSSGGRWATNPTVAKAFAL